jgi:hypothetical protein
MANWIRSEEGNWVNFDKMSLLEVEEADGDFEVVAYSAYDSSSNADGSSDQVGYCIKVFSSRSEAVEFLDQLMNSLNNTKLFFA